MKKLNQTLTAFSLLMILMSAGCKKPPKPTPQPEDLNKHLFGKVYDETDGERLPNSKIGIFQHTDDGSQNISYKKIAETYSDTNGNFEFYFTKIQGSSYAVQLLDAPRGFTSHLIPTPIEPMEERKKEINLDINSTPLGYVKWHVIGDLGNYYCHLGIGGGGEQVYKGQDETFWESGGANEMITIRYGIKNNGLTILDTSYKVFLPKHDTIFVNIHF